ncbi:cytoplasmic dynein 1 intermediate chain-like isoform X2 [Musca autumnalis]|uniref:cytoplasmic dynein 1 intermediate chain-like isoform X2 n=1 Tax=Musca autumnalis TaxID=221902 RepID=UPI003CF01B4F
MSGKNFDEVIKRKLAKLEEIRQERKHLEALKSAREADKVKIKEKRPSLPLECDFDKLYEETLKSTSAIVDKPKLSKSKSEEIEKINSPVDKIIESNSFAEKLSKLTVFHTEITDIPPRKIFTSTKSTQTKNSNALLQRLVIRSIEDSEDFQDDEISVGGFDSKLPAGCMSPGLPKIEFVMPAISRLESIVEERSQVKEMSEDEKLAFLSNTNFENALKRIGSVVENIVSKNIDVTKDYTRGKDFEDDIDERSRAQVALNRIFDNHMSTNRCITDVDWSPFFTDLIVASYHSNVDEPLAPEGVALVWNTTFDKSSPESIMHCSSAIMSIRFAESNPNIIIGGTYSGQIVLWDTRSPKPIPVQSTKINCGAHVQPIRCLNIKSDSIFSISSDGRLCTWNIDMLHKPIDIFTLEAEKKRPISVTCMTFMTEAYDKFLVGSEDGCVYKANRLDVNPAIKAIHEQHDAPITGISKSFSPATEFNHLFLTSSIDSTIKLWSLHDKKPLHTISGNNNYDYIMDIAWSPTNPALFATVNENAHFDIWNINMNTEEPVVSTIVEGQPALNRISWISNGGGRQIAVGDLDGKLHLYDVDEKLTQPEHDANSLLCETLDMLRQNSLINNQQI